MSWQSAALLAACAGYGEVLITRAVFPLITIQDGGMLKS
jgi:hypothetical protein